MATIVAVAYVAALVSIIADGCAVNPPKNLNFPPSLASLKVPAYLRDPEVYIPYQPRSTLSAALPVPRAIRGSSTIKFSTFAVITVPLTVRLPPITTSVGNPRVRVPLPLLVTLTSFVVPVMVSVPPRETEDGLPPPANEILEFTS